MMGIHSTAWLSVVGCLMLASQQAQAQVPQSGTGEQANTDLSTPALKYFGRGKRVPMARPRRRHQAPPTPPFQLAGGKPFQNVQYRPTISPYLSLDAVESSVGLPNYYSRVLPQIKQQQELQAQSSQLRRLQQQVRLANAPGMISNNRNGGAPTTGHSTQYLNVGGYFPSVQR